MNKFIAGEVTEEELHLGLKELPTRQVLGEDGLPIQFFITLWDSIGNDILKVYKEALRTSELHQRLNTAMLCVIPKGGPKSNLKIWPLITLLGTIYKIIAKTLARRLHPLLDSPIRPNQTSFIKRRSIIDNVFLAFESMEWTIESNQPMVVMLLLDFEKAYDRLEWGFLEGTLSTIGSKQQGIEWVRALYIDSWCKEGINNKCSKVVRTSNVQHPLDVR